MTDQVFAMCVIASLEGSFERKKWFEACWEQGGEHFSLEQKLNNQLKHSFFFSKKLVKQVEEFA